MRNSKKYVLDCNYTIWFHEMRGYIRWQRELEQAEVPSPQPFTFNDVHPVIAAADRYVVLRQPAEVKC